jgi:hypothetical protein
MPSAAVLRPVKGREPLAAAAVEPAVVAVGASLVVAGDDDEVGHGSLVDVVDGTVEVVELVDDVVEELDDVDEDDEVVVVDASVVVEGHAMVVLVSDPAVVVDVVDELVVEVELVDDVELVDEVELVVVVVPPPAALALGVKQNPSVESVHPPDPLTVNVTDVLQ